MKLQWAAKTDPIETLVINRFISSLDLSKALLSRPSDLRRSRVSGIHWKPLIFRDKVDRDCTSNRGKDGWQ